MTCRTAVRKPAQGVNSYGVVKAVAAESLLGSKIQSGCCWGTFVPEARMCATCCKSVGERTSGSRTVAFLQLKRESKRELDCVAWTLRCDVSNACRRAFCEALEYLVESAVGALTQASGSESTGVLPTSGGELK